MITTLQCVNATQFIDAVERDCLSFKIGKTGQSKEQRLAQYKADPNEEDYQGIEFVFSGNKQDVDDMESFLIDYYKDNPKCDNKRDGEVSNNDKMADDEDVYHVYVVWNEKNQRKEIK